MYSKKLIRENTLKKRKSLSDKEIVLKSSIIINNLRDTKEYKNANTIMTYLSFESEVDTLEFIKEELDKNKIILVPFIEDYEIKVSEIKSFNELSKGQFNILEPINKKVYKKNIDLILVPGIAFDKKGTRIGFGKGFYDYFLQNHEYASKIGLAFEEQIINEIKAENHDVPVNKIITDKKIINCKIK